MATRLWFLLGITLIICVTPVACSSLFVNKEDTTLTSEIFFQRCHTIEPRPRTNITCNELWNQFIRLFQCGSNHCIPVTDQAKYEAFVKLIPPVTPVDKTMFYLGAPEHVANNISTRCADKTTIHGTFLGQLFDNLAWCCNRGELVDHPCGRDTTCSGKTLELFWNEAYKVFSQTAQGEAAIILNGSATIPPYRSESYFSSAQLPHLTAGVNTMHAIMAYDRPPGEGATIVPRWTCDSEDSGINELRIEMLRRRINFNCSDNVWWSSETCNGVEVHTVLNWLMFSAILFQFIRLL